MRLVLFLASLDAGGAQRQFVQLADALARRGHAVTLATLVPGGPWWSWLEARAAGSGEGADGGAGGGVRLVSLHPSRRAGPGAGAWRLAAARGRLARLLRATRPHALYSALYVSNLLAWSACRGSGGGGRGATTPLVWGIRASRQRLGWRRRLPYELCRRLSPSVDLLISNSRAGLDDHLADGFRARGATVVPNGIDVDAFRPDAAPAAGARLRAEWGVPQGAPLVGVVGRLTPKKDHPTFLRAAAALARANPGLRFACVGDGPADYRAALEREAAGLGLAGSVVWAGDRADMPAVYNALDLACCCSREGEGFANVIAEAMASAVPCVATDVGDAARIVGPAGRVVPPADPAALAEGVAALLALEPAARARLAAEARARVVARYSVDALAARTEAELARLSRDGGDGARGRDRR